MTTTTIPQWFAETAIGRQMTAERKKEIDSRRAAAIKTIAAIRRREAKEVPPLQDAVMAALLKVKEAEEKAKQAHLVWSQARQRKGSTTTRFDSEVAEQEALLRDTADPAIDAFITVMRARFDRDRHKPGSSAELVQAISVVINEAEHLKLEAGVNVEQQLNELARALPATAKEVR